MMPRFMPGDIAIVDPHVGFENGSACVIWVNGEVSLKLVWDREEEVLLRPMNDKYPEMIIRKDSKVDFRVIAALWTSRRNSKPHEQGCRTDYGTAHADHQGLPLIPTRGDYRHRKYFQLLS